MNAHVLPKTIIKRHWNYRVIESQDQSGERCQTIHEVHYEDDNPVSYSKNPAVVMSCTEDGNWNLKDSLLATIGKMVAATAKPTLFALDFVPNGTRLVGGDYDPGIEE